MKNNKRLWIKREKEYGVEKIYGIGSENFGEHHGGYLNFGWWENADNYITAAQDLVGKLGNILNLHRESRLLDVACGMGAQDIYLHRSFGSEIDALDILWKHVCISKEKVENAGFDNHIRIHYGTGTALPFKDSSFTDVMCIEGAQHFRCRESFFREANRVLESGGKIAIADFAIKRKSDSIRDKLIVKAAQKLWDVPDSNVYGTGTYISKMKSAGFINIAVEECGRFTIPGYFREQCRRETRKALARIRGRICCFAGFFVNYSVYRAFKNGLVEYIIIKAEKG